MTKQNIPRVRFFGSEDEWEKDIIDNISERFDNLRVPITASNRIEGPTPYYGANGIQDYVEGYTHNGEYLLVAEDGASDLKNYPVQYVNGKVWVNNHAHVLSGKKDKINNLFFKSRLQTLNFEKYLVGGSRAKLNADILMKMQVDYPSLPEQSQIGSLFSTIDSLLSSYKDNLENYQSFKKSMLSKMFPKAGETVPEIRLDGFEGEWEEKKLSDGINKIGDGIHGTPNYVEGAEYAFINGNNLINGEIVISEGTKFVDKSQLTNSEKNLNEDTILISINGTIGNLAWYKSEKIMLGKSAAYLVVDNMDKKFIYVSLQTPRIKYHFMNNLTGTTIKNLGLKTIRETPTLVPSSLDEQQAIGSFFANLDDLISSYQSKINELVTLKKKLLQDMFV